MKWRVSILLLSVLAACMPAPLDPEIKPQSRISTLWLPLTRGLPTHATILALAIDPRDPQTIFAAAYDTTGIYASTDRARTWRAFAAGLDRAPVLALRFLDDTLFAGTTAGLYRLRGSHWERVHAIPPVAVYALTRGAEGTDWLATDGYGIFASPDAGQTWAHIPGLDGETVLSAVARDAQTLFAGTSGRGAFVTRDRGQTWQRITLFDGEYVSLIAIHPDDAQTIFLRTRGGLFRSRDAGANWQPLFGGIHTEIVHALLFDAHASRIYAATGGRGVFASDDEGATWQNLNTGLPNGIATLALAQIDAHTLVAGTATGIFVTRDAGKTWQAANEGVGVAPVHALALNPEAGTLFAATEDGLYRTRARGDFEPVGDEILRVPMLSVVVAPSNAQVIYAGSYRRGIFVSRDGGASWNPVGDIFKGRLSAPGLVVDPQNPQTLFARVLFERIYKSSDGGDTWRAVWTGMPDDAEVETISLAPSDSSQMFAGTNNGLYYSRDAGESWVPRGPSGRTVFAIWIDPRDPRVLFIGATDGLYRSDDAGETWTQVGLDAISMTAITRAANGDWFVGTKYNGVWVSRDNAKTWARFGLDDVSVTALVADDARGLLYAATTRGVFKVGAGSPRPYSEK